jgi:hypothetical protein
MGGTVLSPRATARRQGEDDRMADPARERIEQAWQGYLEQSAMPARADAGRGLSRALDWGVADGDRVALYVWNNLPDPAHGDRRYAFVNTAFLHHTGSGFELDGEYYNDADIDRVVDEWRTAGGSREAEPDASVGGIDDWAPEPRTPAFARSEVESAFAEYRARARKAVDTGDWDQWADQFTDDAHYREHHYGYFRSGAEIREWIKSVMQPFPTMEFPVSWYVIDGNRVSALIPNVLPPPAGDDGYFGFDVNTILHYAGDGKWSYEEDVYSPQAAQRVISRWIRAGGVVNSA